MQDLTAKKQRCLGIIAGAGPDAGLAFWRKVLAAEKRRLGEAYRGDLDAPRIRIVSEPELGHVMRMAVHHDLLEASLSRLLGELAHSCDRIVLACHALQSMAEKAAGAVAGDRFVSLPALVRNHLQDTRLDRVGLIGAPSVTADRIASPYGSLWDIAKVETPADPAAVLDLILTAKRIGTAHPDIAARLSTVVAGFSADTILLACTDFSDIALDIPGKRIIDIMDIAADAVVQPA